MNQLDLFPPVPEPEHPVAHYIGIKPHGQQYYRIPTFADLGAALDDFHALIDSKPPGTAVSLHTFDPVTGEFLRTLQAWTITEDPDNPLIHVQLRWQHDHT